MAGDHGLATATVRTLGKRLRRGEITAVELTQYFLERLRRIGPKLNAVVTVTEELALRQARQADRELSRGHDRGPLHGIPYGAKDLLATAGIPTTWGAAPFRDQVFDYDATVVRRLREAGAILVAKLAMVEIAGGLGYRQADASFTGPGRNPWNRDCWAGGSSSGSGAAVAAGLVPLAVGSETWGSIMTPAAYCGVSGLRPTYGRVSRHGAMALSWTLDKLGPLARSADDCGLALAAMAGADPEDPSTLGEANRYSRAEEAPQGRWKLATLKGATDDIQPEVAANFSAALKVLAPRAEFTEIDLPDLPYGAVTGCIIHCEAAAAFEELVRDGRIFEMTAPEDRIGLQAKLLIPAVDYIQAQRIRRHIARAVDEVLAPFDALVTPTLPTVARRIDEDWTAHARRFSGKARSIGGAGNAAGIPALSIPNGFDAAGLPTGLQLVGRAGEENRLLAIADFYQQQTDWHTRCPAE